MANYDRKVESKAHHALVDKIGKERFELWFEDGSRIAVQGNSLVVTAPDSFRLDRLRRTFAADLRAVAAEVLGEKATVEFVTRQTEPKPATESAPAVLPIETNVESPDEKPPSARQLKARLDSFVVGASNQLAYTAIETLPGKLGAANPLVLYGPAGCGKSHLLSGLAAATRRQRKRVVMLTAEEFTTWFLGALNDRSLPSFRYKHRNVDMLIVEDIQFFAGKRATIVEFKQTLDALAKSNLQLVLSADRSPQELNELGPEIQNRLIGGLALEMEYADEESRRSILKQWAAKRHIVLPAASIDFLAKRATGDVRQMQGAINRIQVTQDAFGETLSPQQLEKIAADCFPPARPSISLPEIEKAVCRVFGLQQQVLQSDARTKVISQPRMLAMWLARKYTRAAFSEIGAWFGNRSHSTVISAERKVNGWRSKGSQVRLGHGECSVADAIRRIESELGAG